MSIANMTQGELQAFITNVMHMDRSVLPASLNLKQVNVSEKAGFFGAQPTDRPVVTGSRATGDALVSLLAALSELGLIKDMTTA